jgi:hypothetical protein
VRPRDQRCWPSRRAVGTPALAAETPAAPRASDGHDVRSDASGPRCVGHQGASHHVALRSNERRDWPPSTVAQAIKSSRD